MDGVGKASHQPVGMGSGFRMNKKLWKPGPNHPWNLRTRAEVEATKRKKREFVDVLSELREEEEAFDRLEAAEMQQTVQTFFRME